MRARWVVWAFLVTLASAHGAQAQDNPYYLALGDSLAIGVQPDASGDYAPTNQGYVDDLYAFYRSRVPGLRLAKLGCSGETTTSMIVGNPDCPYGASTSQLTAAVAFLKKYRVVLITLDIGADNLLQCLNLQAPPDQGCVTGVAGTAAFDLQIILNTLVNAVHLYAPQALIVGMNYYDPFLAAAVFPGGQTLAGASLVATTFFNATLEGVYQFFQVPVADVAAAFHSQSTPVNVILALTWTWMSAPAPRGPDVHPNALGYFAIASAFAKTIASP